MIAEQEAHHAAYALEEKKLNGEEVFYDCEWGKNTHFKVYRIKTLNPGIVGHILMPTEHIPCIKVLFQGTYNTASILRDLQISCSGAGSQSLLKEEASILSQIETHINLQSEKCQSSVSVSFSGHSLGGADAQNMFTALIDYKAHHQCFENVHACSVLHANSAGIPKSQAKRAVLAARTLKENPKTSTHLESWALRVKGDSIQTEGEATLFSNIDPKYAHSHMLRIDNGYRSVAQAHTSFFFGYESHDLSPESVLQYATNIHHTPTHASTENDEWCEIEGPIIGDRETLREELENKSLFLNSLITIPIRCTLQLLIRGCVLFNDMMHARSAISTQQGDNNDFVIDEDEDGYAIAHLTSPVTSLNGY